MEASILGKQPSTCTCAHNTLCSFGAGRTDGHPAPCRMEGCSNDDDDESPPSSGRRRFISFSAWRKDSNLVRGWFWGGGRGEEEEREFEREVGR